MNQSEATAEVTWSYPTNQKPAVLMCSVVLKIFIFYSNRSIYFLLELKKVDNKRLKNRLMHFINFNEFERKSSVKSKNIQIISFECVNFCNAQRALGRDKFGFLDVIRLRDCRIKIPMADGNTQDPYHERKIRVMGYIWNSTDVLTFVVMIFVFQCLMLSY